MVRTVDRPRSYGFLRWHVTHKYHSSDLLLRSCLCHSSMYSDATYQHVLYETPVEQGKHNGNCVSGGDVDAIEARSAQRFIDHTESGDKPAHER